MNPIQGSQTAIIVRDDEPSIGSLMRLAIDKLGGESAAGVVEVMGKLVELHERVEARRCAGEFAAAMVEFQRRCPLIPKNRTATVTKAGVKVYSYQYAELPEIVKVVGPLLAELQIGYSWDSRIEELDKDKMRYTCTLCHANGHSMSSSFTSNVDTKADLSGSQRAGAALTYGNRQSFIQVCGLTTCAPDDTDGIPASSEKINKAQFANLQATLEEVKADIPRFLKFMEVNRIEDILQHDLRKAFTVLDQKRRGAGAKHDFS